MALPTRVLAAIQTAGASMSDADIALKEILQGYGDKVAQGMGSNPFDIANDAMFEEWKAIARVSQSVARIEQDLRQVYAAVAQMMDSKRIAAPVIARIGLESAVMSSQETVTDAVVKSPRPMQSNSKAVLSNLISLLNTHSFTKVNISELAKASAVPQGSMAATLRRLARDRYIVDGGNANYKLGTISK